jgi:hypothetical protein
MITYNSAPVQTILDLIYHRLGFLSSLVARAAACVWSRGYVNGSGGWICRRLASPVACGVSTAAVDPATSWDEPGCPPLAPGSCEPLGDCCAPPLAPGSWRLLEMTHRSRLAAGRLQVVPHRSLLATGSLLAASLLPPESTWVACLQAATLRARPAAANPATSRSRGLSRRSRTQTLRPGRQECGRWSRKLEKIVIVNHVS